MSETKQEIFIKIVDQLDFAELFEITLNRVMVTIKEPTTGLRHTNMKTVKKIIQKEVTTGKWLEFDGNDVNLFVLSPLYMTDLYVIIGNDIDLTKHPELNEPNAFTMWETLRSDLDEDWMCQLKLACVIVVGKASPYISKDNLFHILKHEIVHYILAYFEFNHQLDLITIDKDHGKDFTEFLCDFLPFYVRSENITQSESDMNWDACMKSFLKYISANFDDDIHDTYVSFLDELGEIVYQYLPPF